MELKQYSVEILALLCSALIGIVVIMIRNFSKNVIEKIDETHNKLDLVVIEQQSTDYALDKNFANGFSIYKAEKKEELMKDYEFKHHKR
jgi:hypothetical protein